MLPPACETGACRWPFSAGNASVSMSCDILHKFGPKLAARIEKALASLEPDLAATLCKRLEVLVRAGVRTRGDAVNLLRDDRSADEWSLAAWVLQVSGGPAVAGRIVAALQAALELELRHACVETLGVIKGSTSREALIAVLLTDGDSRLRSHAARSLGSFWGDYEAFEALIGCLDSDQEIDEVRAAAAQSLGVLGELNAEPELIESLNESSSLIRYWGANALASIGGRRAIEPLRELAERDADTRTAAGSVGESALFAIASIEQRLRDERSP